MKETLKLSLCLTNYNRDDMLIQAIMSGHHIPEIDDIQIYDDGSQEPHLGRVRESISKLELNKVNLYSAKTNLGMSQAKFRAVGQAHNNFVILLDSDNILQQDYINAIKNEEKLDYGTIYMPEAALPQFIYSKYKGMTFNANTIKEVIDEPEMGLVMNTCNYLVHRDMYLATYRANELVEQSDTIWFLYQWLSLGMSFKIVPGMTYVHRVHPGSGWLQNSDYNSIIFNKIKDLIKKI